MAPKQKSADGPSSSSGKSSGTGGNSNGTGGHGNDRQAISERHNYMNGSSTSERSSGAGNDRSSAAGASAHAEKTSSANTGASNSGTKRKAEAPAPLVSVDFGTMELPALRRYCRLNKLKPRSKSREDLVAAAARHWNNVNVKEVDSVAYFLFAVKHRNKVLKLTMPLS
ncbi:hypothetical protein BGZ72_000417 [Mortierella alpina]|nr:hypothetical protein BGZ72_000417 [Mortierella alpina]